MNRKIRAASVVFGALSLLGCAGKVVTSSAVDDDASVLPPAASASAAPAADLDASAEDATRAVADARPDAAPAAEDFDSAACAPVTKGCLGAAGCEYNSNPMPLACTGGATCEAYCRAKTSCSSGPACVIDGGTFRCYTCNA